LLAAVAERDSGNLAIIAGLETELLSAGGAPMDGPTTVDILTQVRRDREEQLMDSERDDESPRS
jgi:hypothetical protein